MKISAGFLVAIAIVIRSPTTHAQSAHRSRDSAGVRIVESQSPAWKSGAGWKLDIVPVLDLGGSSDEHTMFADIRGMVRLAGGRIVVADRKSAHLRFFDSAGRFLKEVGGEGRGPGEFSFLHGVARCAGDSIIAFDNVHPQLFDSSGHFVRALSRISRASGGLAEVVGVSNGCTQFAVQTRGNIPTPARIVRPPFGVFWFGTDGAVRDSVATVPGPRMQTGPGVATMRPWDGESIFAVSGDLLYVGLPDDFEIRAFDSAGKLRSIFHVQGPRPAITSADRKEFERRVQEFVGANSADWHASMLPSPSDDQLPAIRPAFVRMIIADDGTIWLREIAFGDAGNPKFFPAEAGAPPVAWQLLGPDGSWLGQVQIPARFQLLGVESGMAYGVYRDAEDLERVRVYRILKDIKRPAR